MLIIPPRLYHLGTYAYFLGVIFFFLRELCFKWVALFHVNYPSCTYVHMYFANPC